LHIGARVAALETYHARYGGSTPLSRRSIGRMVPARLGGVILPDSARAMIESGRLAHLVTLNRDGSPQVSCVWVGLDGDDIVSGHLFATHQKVRNVRRDPRVSLSIEGTDIQPPGLLQYLVVHGRARVTEGGAPVLLQELAYRYLGADVTFPPMPDPPPGVLIRITVERLGGVGPWAPRRA
jgi:PPOX class probable F420-dependent enzyme